ncbi:MAG TPA: LacI family transcriptional regulator [Chloroflexi bacterium]|nr:LacI family transcriptional regulator [Chloroflexota bacterium]
MASRITIADVSREAGVGVATVSRALSPRDHPDVSASTREHVRSVADKLGYRPSYAARALRSRDYHAISIFVPDRMWAWWEPAVREAYIAADGLGYRTLVQPFIPSHSLDLGPRKGLPADSKAAKAASAVASLVEIPTDGVLIFGSADDASVRDAATRLRLPIVTVDDVADPVLVPTVATDNRAGVRFAVEHLISRGRKRIAYVGSTWDTLYTRERRAGYESALADAGIRFDPRLVISCSNVGDESLRTYPEFDRFIASRPEIDAIVCEADELAPPVLRSLRANGLRVPDDVSIVGFDDERAALLVDPPLTTIRQPYEELARCSLQLLVRAMGGEQLEVTRQLIVPQLVVRSST